jgi:hypothetical protein
MLDGGLSDTLLGKDLMVVPEAATLTLLGVGLVGVGTWIRRRMNTKGSVSP